MPAFIQKRAEFIESSLSKTVGASAKHCHAQAERALKPSSVLSRQRRRYEWYVRKNRLEEPRRKRYLRAR
jgi:hypothetical protein